MNQIIRDEKKPQEEELTDQVITWLMEVKYWLGYLVGQTGHKYISHDQLIYYWYQNNGYKVVIEQNDKKLIDKNLKSLSLFYVGSKSPFIFRYPRNVSRKAYEIVEKLINDHFSGIECYSTFAICQVGEHQYCANKYNQTSICRKVDNKYICWDCIEFLRRKADKVYSGYVYLIGNQEKKIYKIGKSRQPKERYKTVATKLPFPVEVIHVIGGDDVEKAEKNLHNYFSQKRTHGEWFELSEDDVSQILNLVSFDGKDFWDTNENKVELKQ